MFGSLSFFYTKIINFDILMLWQFSLGQGLCQDLLRGDLVLYKTNLYIKFFLMAFERTGGFALFENCWKLDEKVMWLKILYKSRCIFDNFQKFTKNRNFNIFDRFLRWMIAYLNLSLWIMKSRDNANVFVSQCRCVKKKFVSYVNLILKFIRKGLLFKTFSRVKETL